jgi:hypothetical protein
MKFHCRILLLLTLCLGLPCAARAESWFKEARQIRKDADQTEPRSKNFEILPVSTFSADGLSAGAFFQDKGERIIARRVQIRVSLPVRREKGQLVFKERVREQSYTGEPGWSCRWREPWAMGFFNYTVSATYKGHVYTASFNIGKNGLTDSIAGR